MRAAYPRGTLGNREPQARRLRSRRSPGRRSRRALRCGRRPDRRVRAVLLVRRRDRNLLRRRRDRPGCRAERGGGARFRAAARDGVPCRAARRGARRAARGASVRGARPRRLRARPVKARLFTDGGARGNPGPAAYGYVLEAEDGTVLAAAGEAIGTATNNIAEYSGLVAGLQRALELHVPEVEVVSDSELMVKQMRGEYRVKNAALRELYEEAVALARRVGSVEYRHVKRAHNELADRLVNDALDAA